MDSITLEGPAGESKADRTVSTVNHFRFSWSSDTLSVEISDLVFPVVEGLSEPDSGPGPGTPGAVRVKFVSLPDDPRSPGGLAWLDRFAGGKDEPRNFTLEALSGVVGETLATYGLQKRRPVSWSLADRPDSRESFEERMVVRCETMTYSNLSRPDMGDWLTRQVQQKPENRTVTINLLDLEGNVTGVMDDLDAFITRVSFPQFDARGTGPAEEAFVIRAGDLRTVF